MVNEWSIFSKLRIASASQYADFLTQMGRTVIYRANTPYFLQLRIDDEKFSGLSSYVYKGKRTVQNDYYTTLDWYGAVYE